MWVVFAAIFLLGTGDQLVDYEARTGITVDSKEEFKDFFKETYGDPKPVDYSKLNQ